MAAGSWSLRPSIGVEVYRGCDLEHGLKQEERLTLRTVSLQVEDSQPSPTGRADDPEYYAGAHISLGELDCRYVANSGVNGNRNLLPWKLLPGMMAQHTRGGPASFWDQLQYTPLSTSLPIQCGYVVQEPFRK